MTKKHFVKQCMAYGATRNFANQRSAYITGDARIRYVNLLKCMMQNDI